MSVKCDKKYFFSTYHKYFESYYVCEICQLIDPKALCYMNDQLNMIQQLNLYVYQFNSINFCIKTKIFYLQA